MVGTDMSSTALFACLLCLSVCEVKTTVTHSPYVLAPAFNDMVITNDVSALASARSKLSCGRACSAQDGCVAFTFGATLGGSDGSSSFCVTYSAAPGFVESSTSPAAGARTYKRDPCQAYTILDDVRRNLYRGQSNLCDNGTVDFSWNRFLHDGANAVMASDEFIWYYKCGTDIPLVMDLQGQDLPSIGQEVEVRACGPQGCGWMKPLTVRRCSGGFYIYKLKSTSCNVAYCTLLQSD